MVRRRLFNNQSYSLLDVTTSKAKAKEIAKDWRKEGFSMRVTLEGNRYHIWKSTERSAKAVALRRKTYHPSKRR